jgi:transposase
MAQWVLLQLNHGKYGIQQIVSPANLAEVHKPQTVMNDPARIRLYGTDLLVYALGWVMHHHRGHKMIWHTGGIDGFVANVSFMPDINAGAVILANLNVTRLGPALLFTLYDRLLGLGDFDWSARFKSVVAEMQQEEQEADQKLTAARIPNTQLSHSLDDYTGAFEHPGYGVITVERNGDGLRQVYNDLPHAMTHYHYDSFDTVFDIEMRHQRFVVSYTTDAQGKIACLLVPFEPLLPPLEFRRWATV